MSLRAIVEAVGGDLYEGGRRANIPAPGHSAEDRSVSLLLEGDPLRVRTSAGEGATLGPHDALRFGPGDAVELQFSSAGATRVLLAEFALPGEARPGDGGGASG